MLTLSGLVPTRAIGEEILGEMLEEKIPAAKTNV